MSLQAYQTQQKTTEGPRQSEYRLLAAVTRSMIDARDSKDSRFYKAIDWNRRVWLTLQTDLVSENNGLPDDLKAKLISLSIWVDKHSSGVLRDQKSIEPLIAVNRSIMEGLAA